MPDSTGLLLTITITPVGLAALAGLWWWWRKRRDDEPPH